MEAGLAKLDEVWGLVAFAFAPHKEGSDVQLVKMAEEDFEASLGRTRFSFVAIRGCDQGAGLERFRQVRRTRTAPRAW